MMGVKERNKRIKEVLGREFGYKNVRVRGGRGTAYGWVLKNGKKRKTKIKMSGFQQLGLVCVMNVER